MVDGKEYQLPIVRGTEGEKAIDITSLRKSTGFITLDAGYENTGSCRSAITFIDGEKGILRYRGYPIEELAAKSTFTEVAYLLLYGELPRIDQLEEFSTFLNESSLIHEDMLHFFVGFPRGSHPMGILATTVASLSTFYPIPEVMDETSSARSSTTSSRRSAPSPPSRTRNPSASPSSIPPTEPRYVPNFLNMMFSSPVKESRLDDDIVRAIDLFLILHADHEQNCSTSTVRLTGSSLANVYAVISAGISALWGPPPRRGEPGSHPDAGKIRDEGGDGTEFVSRAKDKNTPDRLMGFGHRVYKNFDPRAKILKEACHRLLKKPGMNDPLFDIALRLEEIALKDDYFVSRNLYPNVDFYSGLILRAAGIPYDMFTVLFAIGRTPGWLAHWREMYHGADFRIMRPRQVYVGSAARHYVERNHRK